MTKIVNISSHAITANSPGCNSPGSPDQAVDFGSPLPFQWLKNAKKNDLPPLRVPPSAESSNGFIVGATFQGLCKSLVLNSGFQWVINAKWQINKETDNTVLIKNLPVNAPHWERQTRLRLIKSTAPVNRLLNRQTGREQRRFITRMGYGAVVSVWNFDTDIDRLSGSSINRANSKIKRDEREREALFEAQKEAEATGGESLNELLRSRAERKRLLLIAANKRRVKKFFSAEPSERGLSLHFTSQRSKGKVRDKFTAFFRTGGKRSKKIFVTLTFIQEVDDLLAQSILNKFLTELRDRFPKKTLNYIWVAERQGNGNIHFHGMINQFLPVRKLNALWTLQQYNSGLRYFNYDEQFWVPIEEIKARYKNDMNGCTHGGMNEILNPFDVEPVKTIHGLSHYLTQYVTKNNSGGGFKCAAWHCSRGVSKLFTKTVISRSTLSAVQSVEHNSRVVKKTGEVVKHPGVSSQYFQLYYIENKPYFLPEMAELEMVNTWILGGMKFNKLPRARDEAEPEILKVHSRIEQEKAKKKFGNVVFEKGQWIAAEPAIKKGDTLKFNKN